MGCSKVRINSCIAPCLTVTVTPLGPQFKSHERSRGQTTMRLLQYKRLSSLPVNLLYESETSGFLYDNLGTNLNKFEKSEDAIDIIHQFRINLFCSNRNMLKYLKCSFRLKCCRGHTVLLKKPIYSAGHNLRLLRPPPPRLTHRVPSLLCSVYFQTLRSIINRQYIPDPVTIIISISLPLQYTLRNELDTRQVSSDFRFPID